MFLRRSFPLVSTILKFSLIALVLVGQGFVWAVELPQKEEYQKVLRDYFGRFKVSDFEIEAKSVEYNQDWLDTPEKAYPIWLAFVHVPQDPLRSPMERPMFRAPSTAFLLSSIESPEGIRMSLNVGRTNPVNPLQLAWWATWKYPGNPWYGNQALLNRAFVMAAVDLIMDDTLIHASPTGNSPEDRQHAAEIRLADRADFIGGRFIWLAYIYKQVKDQLPPEVARAYETGLVRLLERIEAIGPEVRTDNMNAKTLPGLVYLVEATGSPEIRKRAEAYANRIIGPGATVSSRTHPAGVIRDAGGLEASYNGLALDYITWAALAAEWPVLRDGLNRMMRFKSLMTLPEPDGRNYYGPSHFNPRVNHDSANDQWGSQMRDLGAAMISPQAEYLIAGGRAGYTPEVNVPSLEKMQQDIKHGIAQLNRVKITEPYSFEVWKQNGTFGAYMPFATAHYQPESYTRFKKLLHSDDPQLRPPVLRDENFTTFLPEDSKLADPLDRATFFLVRRPSYYLISFTGRLGFHTYLNWGGGGISAYWTPQCGSVLLGRSGGYHGNHWEDWRIWPVNTVSGLTAAGDAFSAARLRRIAMDVKYEREGDIARATVSAPLHAQSDNGRILSTGQQGELRGNNHYTRVIEADANSVRVTVRLQSDGTDQLCELFETLPVFIKDMRSQKDLQPTSVEFQAGGQWQPATEDYLPNVQRIRLSRYSGSVEIELERPRSVRLAANPWLAAADQIKIRSLQIDLLNGSPAAFPNVELNYRIRNMSFPSTTRNAFP